jgi:hypothetical protein
MRAHKLGAVALLLAAGFDPAPWKYRAPLRAPAGNGLAVFPFDATMYANMRADLGDLRIVQDGGEVPFFVETVVDSLDERECHPTLVNRSAGGDGVEVTADLAVCRQEPRHSRIRLATGESNFRSRVRIETSDDNRRWSVAREDGYIFDFTQDGRKFSALTVDYPLSTRRYVRATVFGWTKPDAITDAWSLYRTERRAQQYTIANIAPARSEDAATRSSLLLLDLGRPGLTHSRVRLEAEGGSFHRAVELEASGDAKTWTVVATGTIFQVPGERSLSISFPERRDRYLRIRVFNGDDRPPSIQRVVVETPRRLVKFQPRQSGEMWVYYGNAGASAPVYDLAMTLSRQAPAAEVEATVGEPLQNPEYRAGVAPWSDRNPAVLYSVLGAAILVMGVVTVRFLRKVA